MLMFFCVLKRYTNQTNLHLPTLSFPTRRPSVLKRGRRKDRLIGVRRLRPEPGNAAGKQLRSDKPSVGQYFQTDGEAGERPGDRVYANIEPAELPGRIQ